jgi:hypothetical protein
MLDGFGLHEVAHYRTDDQALITADRARAMSAIAALRATTEVLVCGK